MNALLYVHPTHLAFPASPLGISLPTWSRYEWEHPYSGHWSLQPWGPGEPAPGRRDVRNIERALPLAIHGRPDATPLDRLIRMVNAHTRQPEVLGRGVLVLQETYDLAAVRRIGEAAVLWLGGAVVETSAESNGRPTPLPAIPEGT